MGSSAIPLRIGCECPNNGSSLINRQSLENFTHIVTSGLGHPDARNAPFALLVHVACGSCRRIAERMWGAIKPCGIPCRSDAFLPPPFTCSQFGRSNVGRSSGSISYRTYAGRIRAIQYTNPHRKRGGDCSVRDLSRNPARICRGRSYPGELPGTLCRRSQHSGFSLVTAQLQCFASS